MKRLCACVVTSEKTWQRNQLMALNDEFFAAKDHFDLAIVHNGSVTPPAAAYFSKLSVEHFIARENVGNEGGAFNAAIHQLPHYDWYLFLHDDHWLWRADWAAHILPSLQHNGRACFGNLVTMKFHWDQECNDLSKRWNFSLQPADYVFPMLQGTAGFHSRSAIEAFLQHGGVPHFDYKQEAFRGLTHFAELAFSLFLIHAGFRLEPLPGGFEYLLLHGSNALCDHNRDSFDRLPRAIQDSARLLHAKLHG